MKIKRLFHISVLGNDLFVKCVARYGKRQAIKEVNAIVRKAKNPKGYLVQGFCGKDFQLATWYETPQGHMFWSDLHYGRR